MQRFAAGPLTDFVREIFERVGCHAEEAGRVAAYLVESNLAGHDSHGVIRVPFYVQQVRDGLIVPNQEITVPVDTPVLAVVDANYAFGQSAGPKAVRLGIEKCKAMGLSAVALRNSGHIGRIGDWSEAAAAEGLVSVHFVNASGSLLVAPFGGVERRFSTAPYSIGVPRPGLPPLILDMATSTVAEGKVLVASRGGKKLPEGSLISAEGELGIDPVWIYGAHTPDGPRNHRLGTGAIRAFGEHKGSGLAFMCELLGGALTGNKATQPNKRFANGMLSFYIDPQRIDPEGLFDPEVARYTAYVKSARPIDPDAPVLVPGEPEQASRAERRAGGIPLSDDTWAAIRGAATSLGIAEAGIPRAL